MSEIEIFEQELLKDKKKVGKIAILRGGLHNSNPKELLNNAVETYVGNCPYNEFVEIFLDNPWVRVVISGINELEYKQFMGQKIDG